MDIDCNDVERHYGRGQIFESIMRALREMRKDVSKLSPADLALVDEFHTRGRAATIELARRAALTPGLQVLDVVIVGSLSDIVGLAMRILSINVGSRNAMLSVPRDYVFGPPHIIAVISWVVRRQQTAGPNPKPLGIR